MSAPTLAEAQRDAAHATCWLNGHSLGEYEGEVVCVRCGDEALDVEEPGIPASSVEDPLDPSAMTEARKHADLQALLDWDVVTDVAVFGLVVA